MGNRVQVYVYDLSRGFAQLLSQRVTGRSFEGIWHTTLVVFDKEVFYGDGITEQAVGNNEHGAPVKVLDMGETAIDSEAFRIHMTEMKRRYTVSNYHPLDFNCNSFTDECVQFLTAQSIPSWIKDLPSEFLATEFGAKARPIIDKLYRVPKLMFLFIDHWDILLFYGLGLPRVKTPASGMRYAGNMFAFGLAVNMLTRILSK